MLILRGAILVVVLLPAHLIFLPKAWNLSMMTYFTPRGSDLWLIVGHQGDAEARVDEAGRYSYAQGPLSLRQDLLPNWEMKSHMIIVILHSVALDCNEGET